MNTYELLNGLHVVLALISGIGFALRGFVRLVLDRPLANPLVRFGPHLIDTLLLASGVALWVLLKLSPVTAGWFGAKLALIVVYIGLGVAAFRMRDSGRAILTYVAALVIFLAVAGLALYRPI